MLRGSNCFIDEWISQDPTSLKRTMEHGGVCVSININTFSVFIVYCFYYFVTLFMTVSEIKHLGSVKVPYEGKIGIFKNKKLLQRQRCPVL